jgi:hypothetical protein
MRKAAWPGAPELRPDQTPDHAVAKLYLTVRAMWLVLTPGMLG